MNQQSEVLCAGIMVADHVCTPITHVPAAGELVMADSMLLTIGGCAANAAVDLAKMGVRAAIVGRVGKDVFGRIVLEMLREADVDVSRVRTSTTADTSQTLIVNVTGQDRRFIHTFGANEEFSAADIPQLNTCKIFYLGGYLLMPNLRQEELVPVFQAAQAHGIKTVLDVAIPRPGAYLPRLDQLLPHVDVFLPNSHEAEVITGLGDPLEQAVAFQKLGAGTTVITMGGAGAVLVSKTKRLRRHLQCPVRGRQRRRRCLRRRLYLRPPPGPASRRLPSLCQCLGASCVRAIGTTPGVFRRAECEVFLEANALRIERV